MQSTYISLLNKVSATRAKESAILLLSSVLLTIAVQLWTILAISFIEMFANGDTGFRTFLAIFNCVVFIGMFSVFVVPPLLRIFNIKGLPTINEIALRIGNAYPVVKDKLGNAMQLVANKEKNIGSSADLIDAEVDDVYKKTKSLNFDVIINYKKRLLIFFFATLLIFGITFFAVGLSEPLYRIANFSKSFIPPAPFSIELEQKYLKVIRGDRTSIVILAKGNDLPDVVWVHFKENTQNNYDSVQIKRTDNTYKFEINPKQNLDFFAKAKWINTSVLTPIGKLEIIDKPIIKQLNGVVHLPAYTKQGNKQFDETNADIVVLRGSTADFNIRTNKPIKNAYLIFEKNSDTLLTDTSASNSVRTNADTINMNISSDKANVKMRINETGIYYFKVIDNDGLTNENPIKYSIVADNDEAPSIRFIYPENNVEVTSDAKLPIKVLISDDYGFHKLELKYRQISSRFGNPEENFRSINIPISNNDLLAEVPYMWDLSKIGIMPEDIYEFYLEVSDNDFNHKTAKTQTLQVRLPSLSEVANEADKMQEQISNKLENINKETENLRKDMDNFQQELARDKTNKELTWKQQKQLQDILNRQEKLENAMQQMSEQIEQTANKLEQNNMLSQETMQKYQELQKLMSEVRSPQLDRLRQMQQEQLAKMTPEQLRQQMENVKIDEERFKQNIERTMNILKRLKAEQMTDAITKRTEELKNQQDSLNKQLNNGDTKELAKKQQMLKDELNSIKKDMEQLKDLMKEIGTDDMPMKEMNDALQAMNQDIDKDMENASQQMQNGDKNKASQSQKNASSKLSNLQDKMNKLKQEMQNRNSKEVVRKLLKNIEKMAEMSKSQENLKNKTKNLDPNSTQIPKIAAEQAELFENLYMTALDMQDLANMSFEITPEIANGIFDAMKSMRQSMDKLTERAMQPSAKNQTEAMQAMNSAMKGMQQAAESASKGNGSCDNPGGSGEGGEGGEGSPGMGEQMGPGMGNNAGFGQRLSQMAAEQQAMMQQMQQMGGKDGEGMSQEERAAMKRLSGNQEKMQKEMEKMANENQNFGAKPEDIERQERLKGEMKKLSAEMQEVSTQMKSGNITPETMERQEKILSKMLDLTYSQHKKDYNPKRESTSGRNMDLTSPSLSLEDIKSKSITDLMRLQSLGYTQDYEKLIRQYYEKLSK